LPARQEAEFQRRADRYQFGCLQRGDIGLRLGSVVGTADHHAQRVGGRADPYRTAAGNTKLIVNSKPLSQARTAGEEMSAAGRENDPERRPAAAEQGGIARHLASSFDELLGCARRIHEAELVTDLDRRRARSSGPLGYAGRAGEWSPKAGKDDGCAFALGLGDR